MQYTMLNLPSDSDIDLMMPYFSECRAWDISAYQQAKANFLRL